MVSILAVLGGNKHSSVKVANVAELDNGRAANLKSV
jgi:hypothetical protein